MKTLRKILVLSLAFVMTLMTLMPLQSIADFAYAESDAAEVQADGSSADASGGEDLTGADASGEEAADSTEDKAGMEESSGASVVKGSGAAADEASDIAGEALSGISAGTPDATNEAADTAETVPLDMVEGADLSVQYEGRDFDVTIDSPAEAGLPEDTGLDVKEITEKDKEYKEYYDKALEAVQDDVKNKDVRTVRFVRLYDMTLTSGDEVQEPGAAVGVTIDYSKAVEAGKAEAAEDPHNVRIIHFKEDEETGDLDADLLEAEQTGATTEGAALTETSWLFNLNGGLAKKTLLQYLG